MTEKEVREEIAEFCAMWTLNQREEVKRDMIAGESAKTHEEWLAARSNFDAHTMGAIIAERIGQFALLGWSLELNDNETTL